ncbi:hypothetical protein D3C78_1879890 [compost metagenome]
MTSVLEHLDRKFRYLVAPQGDLSGTLLQCMKMKASGYRAFRHVYGEGEAADARVLFQHRGVEGW